jgi:hypothetical protein
MSSGKILSAMVVVQLLLMGCTKNPVKNGDLGMEDKLVGSWRTVEEEPTIYSFLQDHTLTTTYVGGGPIVQNASEWGNWRLDGNQLIIVKVGAKVNGSIISARAGSVTTTNIVVAISDSTMVLSNTLWRLGVAHGIEIKLNRVETK